MEHKLGKLQKKYDKRNLQFARYISELIEPPKKIDHASRLPSNIGMMANDQYGDCTVAAAGHMVQSWSTYAERGLLTIGDDEILDAYFEVSPNDEGAYMLDVLKLWRNNGVGTDKIEAFAEIAPADLTQAKLAIQYFGSAYLGVALPDINTFGPWTEPNPTWAPNPYNGHAICALAYDDSTRMFDVATWGKVVKMSYGFYQKYMDEGYAVLNDLSIIIATGKSPEGFNWAALQDDLGHIKDPVTPPEPTSDPVVMKKYIALAKSVDSGASWKVLLKVRV